MIKSHSKPPKPKAVAGNKVSKNSKTLPKVKVTPLGSKKKIEIQPKLKKSSQKSGYSDLNVPKLINAGISAVDTVVTTLSNPVDGIVNKLPNTVAKFVDAMGSTNPVVGRPEAIVSGPLTTGSKDEKFVEALKTKMPVVQLQSIPSGFASEYKPPPVSVTETTLAKMPCTKVAGSVVLGQVGTHPTGGLFQHRSAPLNPYELGGQIASIGANYQKHMWLSVGLFYIPFVSTQYLGNVILTFQNSPVNTYTPTTNINLLSQRTHFTMGSAYKGLTLPLQAEFKQQYNMFATRSSDLKFYADWCFEVWTYQCSPNITIGVWGITYEVLFFSRVEDPTIAVNSLANNYVQFLADRSTASEEDVIGLLDKAVNSWEDGDRDKNLLTVSNLERTFVTRESTQGSIELLLRLLRWEEQPMPGTKRSNFLSAVESLLTGESRYLIFLEKIDRTKPSIILLFEYILLAYNDTGYDPLTLHQDNDLGF